MYIISYNANSYFVTNNFEDGENRVFDSFIYKAFDSDSNKKIKSLLFLKGIKLNAYNKTIEIDKQTFNLIEKYMYIWAIG
jgi:hypothetical protein